MFFVASHQLHVVVNFLNTGRSQHWLQRELLIFDQVYLTFIPLVYPAETKVRENTTD